MIPNSSSRVERGPQCPPQELRKCNRRSAAPAKRVHGVSVKCTDVDRRQPNPCDCRSIDTRISNCKGQDGSPLKRQKTRYRSHESSSPSFAFVRKYHSWHLSCQPSIRENKAVMGWHFLCVSSASRNVKLKKETPPRKDRSRRKTRYSRPDFAEACEHRKESHPVGYLFLILQHFVCALRNPNNLRPDARVHALNF